MFRFLMFRLGLVFLSSLLLGTLCACSKKDKAQEGWFRDRSGDYVKHVEERPVLKVPEPAKTESFSEDYQIPE